MVEEVAKLPEFLETSSRIAFFFLRKWNRERLLYSLSLWCCYAHRQNQKPNAPLNDKKANDARPSLYIRVVYIPPRAPSDTTARGETRAKRLIIYILHVYKINDYLLNAYIYTYVVYTLQHLSITCYYTRRRATIATLISLSLLLQRGEKTIGVQRESILINFLL